MKANGGTKSDCPTTVTLHELETRLWAAATILRGSPVDRTDWKSYILPLLFFKRICDVWDEEVAELTAEFGDPTLAQFPESHRFQIPEGSHWRVVRETPSNVGTALQNAFRGIESANQAALYGVFGDAQWTNKDRLPDSLLKDLIEEFSALRLGNRCVTSDILGDAYEYLIKKFADETNKKAGEFYTPRTVVRLMADILSPREGETVYDPACGTGGMLLAAVEHVRSKGGDPRTFFGRLYGQEKNLTTSAIARMNLFLHGVEDATVVRGDTLRNPAFYDAGRLATFDCVIANPPFSLEKWGEEVWANDPWHRNFAGLPPSSSGDFAWVQHMVCSMAERVGRMAVVLPLGALFHTAAEGKIRTKILQSDLIETVIGLGPNLFYGTGIPACILVLKKTKPACLRNRVYFIDASHLFRPLRNQNELTPDHAKEIIDLYGEIASREGLTRVVESAELRENDWSLFPALYIWNENALNYASKGQAKPPPNMAQAAIDLRAAQTALRAAEDALRVVVEEHLEC